MEQEEEVKSPYEQQTKNYNFEYNKFTFNE